MALTIAIEGLGVIANADQVTNDTGGTGTGDWGFLGSGGVSWGATTDTFYFGTTAMSMALSGSGKNGWVYFDRGAGNELNFGGTHAGQHVYLWIHCPTIGLSATRANAGVGIRIGSSTSDFRTFVVAGSDGANGWTGGWRCFVIDPTKAGSITDTGTYNSNSIRYIGIRGQTTSTAKGDNFFISQIAVGKGLRITGTSTTGWLDAVTYCTALASRAWGMLQEREGIYYAYGTIWIGSAASQAAAVSFADAARIIQFGISEYWSGSAWVTSANVNYAGLVIEDHSSYTTTFTDGVLVGSDEGRSGSVFLGNANHTVNVDLYGGNNAGSLTKLYGTTFSRLSGSLVAGNDADFQIFSAKFIACAQFSPLGAVQLRNCIFAETSDADAALLWDENIDIDGCKFIANTTGAAIEHAGSAGSPYDYYNLTFSGNTYDGLNTAGSNITVNNNGTSNGANDEGANTITYLSSATLTMVVSDEDGDPIVGALAYIDDDNSSPYIMNTTTNGSGIASVGHTAGAVAGATWRVRKYGFKQFRQVIDIPASGTKEIPVTLVVDPQQT